METCSRLLNEINDHKRELNRNLDILTNIDDQKRKLANFSWGDSASYLKLQTKEYLRQAVQRARQRRCRSLTL
jgi:hypothetical protein